MTNSSSSTEMDDSTTTTQYGNDDASDAREDTNVACSLVTRDMTFLKLGPPNGKASPDAQPIDHLPMPQVSSGLVTFAYNRALLNRIKDHKLNEGGRYDISKFTPTFVHDSLMLPGSLANLIGKASPEDILKRITPALLPGHHLHIHPQDFKPSLTESRTPGSHVQGMVIFGQGKTARDFIHRHYRLSAKRKKVRVEIEIMVLKCPRERLHERDLWRPERRIIHVHAWKRSGRIEGCDAGEEAENYICPNWSLEGYLAGTLGDELPMRVEMSAKGDEEADGYLGRDMNVFDVDVEVHRREVIYSGPGLMHYERIKGEGWSGW